MEIPAKTEAIYLILLKHSARAFDCRDTQGRQNIRRMRALLRSKPSCKGCRIKAGKFRRLQRVAYTAIVLHSPARTLAVGWSSYRARRAAGRNSFAFDYVRRRSSARLARRHARRSAGLRTSDTIRPRLLGAGSVVGKRRSACLLTARGGSGGIKRSVGLGGSLLCVCLLETDESSCARTRSCTLVGGVLSLVAGRVRSTTTGLETSSSETSSRARARRPPPREQRF